MTAAASFPKRTFGPLGMLRRATQILLHLPDLRRRKQIDRALAEKIMLAVTQVNDCRYCRYFHVRQARAAGVSEDDIRLLLHGELGDFPPEQQPALEFARHYALSHDQPAQQDWQLLVTAYGAPAARSILAYIRIITFGNLLGNTFDWFVWRLNPRRLP